MASRKCGIGKFYLIFFKYFVCIYYIFYISISFCSFLECVNLCTINILIWSVF